MKSVFELIGFLATVCISGFLVFTFIGSSKKDIGREALTSRLERAEPALEEPASVSQAPARRRSENSGVAMSPRKKNQAETAPVEHETGATDVKALYTDGAFVTGAVRKWKNVVKEASEEYSLKPQVLLAHVIVQSYLGGYNKNRFNADLEEHAGEKVMPVAAAVKRYEYGWSIKKLIEQYDLTQYFPEEIPTANAGYNTPTRTVEKASAKRDFKSEAGASAASFAASAGKVSQMEDGFRRLVAKEFGAGNWQELQQRDAGTKAKAQQRVKMLMTSARIK